MSGADLIAQAISLLPNCAVACLLQSFGPAGCDATNLPTCYCANVPLQYNISTCVQLTCNVTEQATSSSVQQMTCAGVPFQNRADFMLIPLILLSGLFWAIVCVRFLIRWTITKSFWWDDWTMLFAAVLAAGTFAVEYELIRKGLGKHVWDIDFSNIQVLDKLYYGVNILYVFNCIIIKVSIVFLYARIFSNPRFHRYCWGTQIFLLAFGTTYVSLVCFRCTPIRATWENGNAPIPGAKCLSYHTVLMSGAAINIAADLWVLLLPIQQLLKLEMNISKRIQLLLMFNIGAFACVTSMIRIKFVSDYSNNSTDSTYDRVNLTFWSTLEVGVAYLCANLPSVRPLIRLLIAKFLHNGVTEIHSLGDRSASASWSPSGHRRSQRDSYFSGAPSPATGWPFPEPETTFVGRHGAFDRDQSGLDERGQKYAPTLLSYSEDTEMNVLKSPHMVLFKDHR